jgi:hypothetical protein
MAQAIGAVDDAMKGVALGALARIPIDGRFIAVKIGIVLIIVCAAHSRHDAITHVRADPARMGVVRRADPIEGAIVFVLIAINLFPLSIDRPGKGIITRVCRSKIVQGAGSDGRCAGADAHPL